MASTIQIKRGTGSAVPSGLLDGELALNLDNGKLYYGSGSAVVNSFRFTNLTAENYIVSSSVTNITTQELSGSTVFGNSSDDTHTFTGKITASAAISSSGNVTATQLRANGRIYTNYNLSEDHFLRNTTVNNPIVSAVGGFNVAGHLTASGDISSSGNIMGDHFIGLDGMRLIENNAGIVTVGFQNNTPIHLGKAFNPITFVSNVTASGNISSSGDIISSRLILDNLTADGAEFDMTSAGVLGISSGDGSTLNQIFHKATETTIGTSNTKGASLTVNKNLFTGITDGTGHITASGNISASGIVTTGELKGRGTVTGLETAGYLSSSVLYVGNETQFVSASLGNISASGTVFANDITMLGNISASATSTASFPHLITTGDTIEFKDGATKLGSLKFSTRRGLQVRDSAGTANNLTTADITASGNISASGTISGKTGKLQYDTGSISATGNVQGDIIKFGNTTTVAGAIYAHTGSGWVLAHSGSSGNASSSLALAVGTNSSGDGMLLRGMANIGYAPGGNNGCALYLESPGSASHASSGTSGHVVRVVGWNYGSDTIYFNPDNTWILRS